MELMNPTSKESILNQPLLRESEQGTDVGRQIYVRGGTQQYIQVGEATYADNTVISAKYTWWNFIPKNLMEQFSNLANLYFLGVGVLQMVKPISASNGSPSMYTTLGFIVFVSGTRALVEDLGRHAADRARNGFKYNVLNAEGKFELITSGDIKVGNIVKVKQNEMIPSDLILLASSHAQGHCFIDKSNLNGETKLEVSSSQEAIAPLFQDEKNLNNIEMKLTYGPPNKNFTQFSGTLNLLHAHSQAGDGIELSGHALLLRESILRNTDYIYGLAVYTGDDTKIQKSNLDGEKPKFKLSFIMRQINDFLVLMLVVQGLICVFAGIAGSWYFNHQELYNHWYLFLEDYDNAIESIYSCFTWVILLCQLVPISLVVTVEMVHYFQAALMSSDKEMYHPGINKTLRCNNSTLHEDLGLVDFIFSDKTGTLTQNKMEFRFLLTRFGHYGSKETDIAKAVRARQALLATANDPAFVPPASRRWTDAYAAQIPPLPVDPLDAERECCAKSCRSCKGCWYDPSDWPDERIQEEKEVEGNQFSRAERMDVLRGLWGKSPSDERKEDFELMRTALRNYAIHMALSNTVKPYQDENRKHETNPSHPGLKFQAESAEELAMVTWAQSVGFTKLSQNPTVLEIQEYDTDLKPTRKVCETYRHLGTLGFSSKRARVTMIYQRASDDRIIIMSKGQDSVMLPLMPGLPQAEEDRLLITLKNLCVNGLRTLVCGHAEQSQEWWADSWVERYAWIQQQAADSMKDRCEALMEEMEKDSKMAYLGVMGLEDQLQRLVPESIKDYLVAGIRVWMITGDKLETAKNIGLACNLIDPDMEPTLSENASVEEYLNAFNECRLMTITGQYSSIVKDQEEMGKLFDSFDRKAEGTLTMKEFETVLKVVNIKDISKYLGEVKKTDRISRADFLSVMKSIPLTLFQAVSDDIDRATNRAARITNHALHPMALLVNREAFMQLFPSADEESNMSDSEREQRKQLRTRFFTVATLSKSVIFARAQPAMKKKMVTEVMARYPEKITLAIGDGANDTEMLQAAHIGIGIAGVEGTAAVNAADYALGTFHMLHPLIFVHGFWSYQRIASLVTYMFYKAGLSALAGNLFMGFYSAMSAQQYFNDTLYQIQNMVFTAIPPIVVAVFDISLPRYTLQNTPAAFKEAKGRAFHSRIFYSWIWRAFLHSLPVFFIPFIAIEYSNTGSDGKVNGIWYSSVVVFYVAVLVPTLIICFNMTTITLLHHLAVWITSVGSLFLFPWAFNQFLFLDANLYMLINRMYADPTAWLAILVATSIPLLLELGWRFLRIQERPSIINLIAERIRLEQYRPYCANFSREELEMWENRKKKTTFKDMAEVAKQQLTDIANHGNKVVQEPSNLRSSVIKAMLRVQGVNGATFHSAASSRYTAHDTFNATASTSSSPRRRRGDFDDGAST